MLMPRAFLGLVALLGVAACTDEGEGSATMTGVGLVVIPWWAIIAVLAGAAGAVWFRKR